MKVDSRITALDECEWFILKGSLFLYDVDADIYEQAVKLRVKIKQRVHDLRKKKVGVKMQWNELYEKVGMKIPGTDELGVDFDYLSKKDKETRLKNYYVDEYAKLSFSQKVKVFFKLFRK